MKKIFEIRYVPTNQIFKYKALACNEQEAIDELWGQLFDFEDYSLVDIKILKGERKDKMSIIKDNQKSIGYVRLAIWAIVAYLVILSAGVTALAISVNALWA